MGNSVLFLTALANVPGHLVLGWDRESPERGEWVGCATELGFFSMEITE